MIYFLCPSNDRWILDTFLTRRGKEISDFATVMTYEELLGSPQVGPGAYVFTGLNRLGPHSSEALVALHDALAAAEGTTALNHPTRTLGRLELLQILHRHRLNHFDAKGAWEDLSAIRFPAFLRDRSRDGGVPRLLGSTRELDTMIGEALVNGRSLEGLIVVEFRDTSDLDGVYRKYAAFMIGGHVIPVGLQMSRQWVVRSHSAVWDDRILDEEREYIEENPHEDQIREVARLARTQWGRIDYSVFEGQVQTWEINTLPRMGPILDDDGQPKSSFKDRIPQPFRSQREALKEGAHHRATLAWSEIEASITADQPVEVEWDEALLEKARAEVALESPPTYPQSERFQLLRTLLKPLKPLLKPIAQRTIVPLLARRARRQASDEPGQRSR